MDRLDIVKNIQANSGRYMVYLINNKRGADGLTLEKQEAEEVLDNVLNEYLERPNGFDPKFIWNRLKSRRCDYIRKKISERDAYERYAHMYYDEPSDNTFSVELKDMQAKIRAEIYSVRNEEHQIALINHLIDGKGLEQNSSTTRAISRFKNKMLDKYGG